MHCDWLAVSWPFSGNLTDVPHKGRLLLPSMRTGEPNALEWANFTPHGATLLCPVRGPERAGHYARKARTCICEFYGESFLRTLPLRAAYEVSYEAVWALVGSYEPPAVRATRIDLAVWLDARTWSASDLETLARKVWASANGGRRRKGLYDPRITDEGITIYVRHPALVVRAYQKRGERARCEIQRRGEWPDVSLRGAWCEALGVATGAFAAAGLDAAPAADAWEVTAGDAGRRRSFP